jgi:hypothetical protein
MPAVLLVLLILAISLALGGLAGLLWKLLIDAPHEM